MSDTSKGALSAASAAVASAVTHVTLFEDRALVVRRATARLGPGASWVLVGDLTPFVDDKSIQAAVLAGAGAEGKARVLAVRIVRRVHEEAKAGREEIDALERAEREARRHVDQADALIASAVTQQNHAMTLHDAWVHALGATPRGLREPESRASWTAAREKLTDRLTRANALADRARRERFRAVEAHARAAARLADARGTFTRNEALAEVHLEVAAEAGEPVDVPFEIRYRTPAALWRPEHGAKLLWNTRGGANGSSIEIVTWATAWQRTGERWDGVTLAFSTARPAQHATAPLLGEDILVARRKTDDEKRQVVVQAREQTIAVAGLGRGARSVDEMPGVDDGGVPEVYAPAAPTSLPSDGRPTRVEIHRFTLAAEVALVVWPERGGVPHVRATATLKDRGPLLAGPVHVARSRVEEQGAASAVVAGTSRQSFVGRGEPFELSFGVDDTVRARRKVKDESDTTPLIGTQKKRRAVTVWVSNLSDEPKRVKVVERIPVSEIEGVEVTLVDARGFRHDAKDGLLEQTVDLGPLETKSVGFSFELRAAAKVVLPVF